MYPTPSTSSAYPNPNPNPMHCFAPPISDQKPPIHIPPSPSINNVVPPPYQLLQHPWPPAHYYYCFPPAPVPVPVPVPDQHVGCCNHTCFGPPPASSYTAFRPPYYHPPSFPCYGFYPPFPGPHPTSYSVPPPHYSTDYDKYPHCCSGCSPRQDDNVLNIQDKKPQLENKTDDSLPPFLFKDPIMWVPPRYMKTETKTTDNDKDSPDPVSLKHLEPSKAVATSELARDQLAGDGKGFPFPIFWFPSNNHEMRKDPKENNNLDLVSCKGPNEEKKETRNIDDGLGHEAESGPSTKHVVQKVLPVKQLGIDEQKKSLETKEKSNSLEKSDNGTEGKDSPKTYKLPPVCLRVDPLPTKKSKRSPSPPADKERSNGLLVDSSKSSLQQSQLSGDLKKSKEEQSKVKVKTIKVANAANKVEYESGVDHGNNVEKGEENRSQKVMAQGQLSKDEPYKVAEKKSTLEEENMSVNEAALIIQSVYRGFKVRKSKPLMKLRQIYEVRNQVVELRKRIHDLSSSFITCISDKQKLIIGETIMSLLLKLDTIQGLHPIVRDIRKSVAKELVGLQEKLDSLTFVKSETPIKEIMSSTELVMHPEHVSIQEGSDRSDGNIKLVESEAAESRNDDGAEACNVNLETKMNENRTEELTINQLQVSVEAKQPVDDAIQKKFGMDQVPADNIDEEVELNTCICENHEVKATNFLHETQATNPDKLVKENTVEVKENQFQMSEELVDDATQEKFDQLQADPDSNVEIIDHCEVEVVESPEDGDTNFCDIRLTPKMEPQSQQIIEEVNKTQLEMARSENPVGQVMFNQPLAQFEDDVENVESWEHPIVEASKSLDDGNVQTLERDVSMAGMKVELPKKDEVNGIQEDYVVATEEAPKVDDVESSTEVTTDDAGGALRVLPTGWSSEDGKLMKDVGEDLQVSFVGDGDRTLVEENEKLRMVVEELMKARKEQLGVIRELTGRVKDVEKKLCKKKKRMKVDNKKQCNIRKVRGFEDELVRDCLV